MATAAAIAVAREGSAPRTPGKRRVFENVQVLGDMPVDDFLASMGLMCASLGWDCANCHVNAGTREVDWAADPPAKIMARRMVRMVDAINRDHFGGRQVVSCFTCHHTRDRPLPTPTMEHAYGAPALYADDLLAGVPGAPPAATILHRYVEALGGAQAVRELTSYRATATSVGFGGFGGGGSVRIWAQAPDRRSTIIEYRDAPGGARQIPVSIREKTATSLEAWDTRVASGPEGAAMAAAWRGLGDDREAFAAWTDRIAAGEIPRDKPPRPEGLERNLVVTVYDWGTKLDGRTDAVASDSRDGTVNPHRPVYMVARSDDILTILDPVENSFRNLIVPSESPVTRDNTPWSPYWGDEPVWRRQSEPRSLAMDGEGRAWLSAIVPEVPRQNPAFCTSPENESPRRRGGWPVLRASRDLKAGRSRPGASRLR